MQEFSYEELLEGTESFSSSTLIGQGSHGWVYKAALKDNTFVAVKRSSLPFEESSKLNNELHVLSSLKEHPNLIKLLGTSSDNEMKKNLLVVEFMPNGSLHEFLHLNSSPPSWPERLWIALQIARVVRFLHEEKPLVIHRDIKSANVLFDSDWNPKLADFGLAIMKTGDNGHDSRVKSLTPPAGTMGYLDPCYTSPDNLSTKIDVYSYGVVLLEIISGRKAIDVSDSPASLADWAVKMIKEQKLMDVCDQRIGVFPSLVTLGHVLQIAKRCVSSVEERPSMGEIVSEMENLSSSSSLSYYSVKRVRYIPIWTSLLMRSMVLLKKRRKLGTWKGDTNHIKPSSCKEEHEEDEIVVSDISAARRLRLKEILADVTVYSELLSPDLEEF